MRFAIFRRQSLDAARRTYQVGYALCGVDERTLFAEVGSLDEQLRASWRPKATVNRYGRTWLLSKPYEIDREIWLGRIGFVNEREVATLAWSDADMDFVQGAAPSGVVVPFVIRTSDGVTVFQLRPGIIRFTTFTGALQALLNSAQNPYLWVVQPLAVHRVFEDWWQGTERVTDFTFRLNRPNPHYHDNALVEQIMEELRLEVGRLSGRAGVDGSVNVSSSSFQQLLNHVLRRYGRGIVRGIDLDGQETEWDSSDDGTVHAKRRIPAVGGEEAPEEVLRDALLAPPRGLVALPSDEADEPSDDATG